MWKLPTEVLSLLRVSSNGAPDRPRLNAKRSQPDWGGYLSEIEQYRELVDDYDGQGAVAPLPEVIDSAVSLARDFAGSGIVVPTYAVAGPNGSIDLAWEFEDGRSVSV